MAHAAQMRQVMALTNKLCDRILRLRCRICVSRPQGSFLMWIELPEAFDAVRLNAELRELKFPHCRPAWHAPRLRRGWQSPARFAHSLADHN
jgi:DNA-binding transcriptional MocR family regulator